MFIENRMYQSQKFQKLHIGLGVRQDGMQFLHCMMLPKENYDLPIFSVFMIGMKRISLAFVDLCPATPDQILPDMFREVNLSLLSFIVMMNLLLELGNEIIANGVHFFKPIETGLDDRDFISEIDLHFAKERRRELSISGLYCTLMQGLFKDS